MILSELLLQILPDQRYRKYLRFFSGLILVLLVVSPLLRAGGLEQRMLEVLDSLTAIQAPAEMEDVMAQAEAARAEGLQEEYQELLRDRVETMAAAHGYQVTSFFAELSLEEGAEDLGEIRQLSVGLSRTGAAEEKEIWVEPVQVGETAETTARETAGAVGGGTEFAPGGEAQAAADGTGVSASPESADSAGELRQELAEDLGIPAERIALSVPEG